MTDWYQSIELPDGEVTPGWFDTRAAAARVPLPERLDGLRCLDVGTRDGFWAFEMERRGAAEVVAIDGDEGQGSAEGFRSAAAALGSCVERREESVYALDPARTGHFDVVFVGSLLHLRHPVLALERVRGVCAGSVVVAEAVELRASLRWPRRPVVRQEGADEPARWQPNRAGLLGMVTSAGLVVERATGIYVVPTGTGHPRPRRRSIPRLALSARGREQLVVMAWGVPHVAVRARRPG